MMENPPHRILLVEDDPLLRQAFRLLLEDGGYEIREAGTAADATRMGLSDVPALVLLDLGLPDASGLDVARALRADERTRDIPVLALTGRVGAQEKAECLAAGCTSYLTKPISPKTLMARIAEYLTD